MCDESPGAETALPADPSAARQARRFLLSSLCSHHHPDAVDRALLLLSELAVNAVEHGTPPVRLSVGCSGTSLRLAVSDGCDRPPVRRRVPACAEGGRGVDLVHRLSSRWGVQPGAVGKTVWCEVPSGAPG